MLCVAATTILPASARLVLLMVPLDAPLAVPFERTLPGQCLVSVGSGIFQVYSGGICVDTVKTRLQNGQGLWQALFVTGRPATTPSALASRWARANGTGLGLAWVSMLQRSNLYAGHLITAAGRFPYLSLNLGSYSQAEQWCLRRNVGGGSRPLGAGEDVFCITLAALISSLSLTVTECPKVMDQLKSQQKVGAGGGGSGAAAGGRTTVVSIVREHGMLRVLQGYDASFLREVGFSVVFLGAPGIARAVFDEWEGWVDANGGVSRAGLMAVSVPLGMAAGFATNSVDELKTRIQYGQFRHLGEAVRWQAQPLSAGGGGGVARLFGKAAMFRAVYIAHGCVSLNFARFEMEKLIAAVLKD